MSGIFDQIINYSPPLIVSGTVNYKGTWDASTNNPPLSNPPVASTKGDYYVVSTAGTQFSISFAVGDWIISSGTAWEKVDLTDAVSSVFGRTGAVVGVSTDYSAVGLTNTAIGASSPSTGAFTTVTASSTIAATGAVTGSNLSGTNTGDQTTITGNAGSATILQTARNINGVSFNGSADITVTAAAGTLTGATLASGVTASSLTSLGTIASLVATTADINGGTIDGTTVGATTPSTVAATTLGASGAVTFNQANAGGGVTLTAFNNSAAATNNEYKLSLNASNNGRAWTFRAVQNSATLTDSSLIIGNTAANVITIANGAPDQLLNLTATGIAITGALSASGNVDIGSSGGSRSISIYGSDTSNAITGTLGIRIVNGNAGAVGRLTPIAFGGRGLANSPFAAIAGYLTADTASEQAGTLRFYAKGTATSGDPSLVMEMDSTSLAVTGALSASGKISTGSGVSSDGAINSFHSGSGPGISLENTSDTSGTFFAAFRKASGGTIGSITRVTTTDAVAFNTTSDARLKENLRDFTDSGRLIDSLKPRVFDWKNSDENGKNVVGFVAQEEHAADPIFAHIGAVSVGDENPETITKQWQRSDSALIPILVAELKSLRARVAALESK